MNSPSKIKFIIKVNCNYSFIVIRLEEQFLLIEKSQSHNFANSQDM